MGEDGLNRYRVVAQRADDAHQGAVTLTNYVYAQSVEEAVLRVRRENERPGGLYGDQGLYEVVEAAREGLSAGERERADLVRLERFVRESVLPRTHPNTTERRRVLEALGEAGGLCTARTVNSDGDVIVCTLDAGHYDPDDRPPFKGGKPGGWHKAGASIWRDSGAASTPHAAT
ncbi:hypothetical protein ABT218_33705 [Streptomyces sp. NPDC001455]|uniref:hypothetical protein n=1 Tax=Streptomyces sp. NPDC001455 TaxID=3154518 RepID=UPI003319F097